MILPTVFVQIPTQNANLVPSKASAHQAVGRQDEIKAEPPIKSEIDTANQLQTVVVAKINKDQTSTQGSSSKITKYSSVTAATTQSNLTANLVTARPKVKCFKCEQCPFISLSQDGYNNHIQIVHTNEREGENTSSQSFRNKMLCPGCENVFYKKKSLKIHLVDDHQMSRNEISQLLDSLFAKKNPSKIAADKTDQIHKPIEKKAEKQKIYLKNMEVLQNPRFTDGQFNVPNIPLTVLSPSESQSECSSNLNDETMNDGTIIDSIAFNRMPIRTTFNQLENDCLYQHITNAETTFPASSSQSIRTECLSMSESYDHISMSTISPTIAITSTEDQYVSRPDSGNSMKFNEHFMAAEGIWPINTVVSNACDFDYQPDLDMDQLPSMKIATNSNEAPSVSPLPTPLNEKKKIYIKNIDILKEPLIKPAQTVNISDSTYRKNTLHLRTVDEVNLLINKPLEGSFSQIGDVATSDYRFVINDTNDYNSIIPQYLEKGVNDFIFPNEPQMTSEPTEYYAGMNTSNFTDLDTNAQDYSTANSANTFDFDSQERSICSGILGNIPNADLFSINHTNTNLTSSANSQDYLNHEEDDQIFQFNKCMPTKTLDSTDYMIVSEEIIDILDLTNDEVEQILDDNMISSQNFEALNSPRMINSEPQYCNRIPRINLASNLTKIPLPVLDCHEGKSIEMRPLETSNIDINVTRPKIASKHNADVTSVAVTVTKKKSGRTKGARQINGGSARNNGVTIKCSISNCGMRFGTQEAMLIHEQCHSADNKEIRCPKCEVDMTTAQTTVQTTGGCATTSSSTLTIDSDSSISGSTKTTSNRNWNWNTLHTHLWREHNIDMELYSCPHCSFKTPILSRLKNTHMKIHSDSRDFKCDYCAKAFKNARQMKNHRRIHTRSTTPTISRCKYCAQSFYSAKHLKQHYLTHSEAIEHHRQQFALQCDICSEVFSSKRTLRIHQFKNHFEEKRFNCDECSYKSNDHNAFRRHQMIHNKEVKYKCPCCSFQCIQSTNYRNHILKNHPESSSDLMFMCDKCSFITVNKKMFGMHCLNHNNNQISSVELD